ncbi:MAG: hypothetical protein MZW92_53665 [Comamonadaceae bacterium]|nr:hypothetical protein [Comamonadaceae bacterium]
MRGDEPALHGDLGCRRQACSHGPRGSSSRSGPCCSACGRGLHRNREADRDFRRPRREHHEEPGTAVSGRPEAGYGPAACPSAVRTGTTWPSGRTWTSRDSLQANPYFQSYWSYVYLTLSSSFERELPLWLGRGLCDLFANTIVRDKDVQLGRVIPWHLETLREGSRLRLAAVLAADRRVSAGRSAQTSRDCSTPRRGRSCTTWHSVRTARTCRS